MRRDRAVDLAVNHHRNIRGDRLEFDDHYYMLDILADPSPETVIMSAVQTGKTELFVAKMLADCELGLSCFYVLPTRDNRDIFVQNRIDRLFAMVPRYELMRTNALGDADSVFMKHLGRGVVRFGSSQSIREFKEFPADVVYVDEFDQCEPSAIGYADDRCKGSPFRFKHLLANPTLPAADFRHNIHWYFGNSDAKRLHYRCGECGMTQPLDWVGNICSEIIRDGVVVKYELLDAEWHDGCGRDIFPVCRKCGSYMDRGESAVGWEPTGNPDHRRSGYHIDRLAPLSEPLDDLWLNFLSSQGNSSMLQVFFNSVLGMPYEGGAGERITETMMERCSETYELPTRAKGPCSMGIDVGKFYDVRISDYVHEQDDDGKVTVRRRLVYADKVPTMEELIELVGRFHVSVAVIDAHPELRKAKEFQMTAPCRVWRCIYPTTEGQRPQAVKWDKGSKQKPNRYRTVTIDRTEAIDAVFAEYLNQRVVEPSGFGSILDGKYMAEMTSSIRMRNDTTGRMYWSKCQDHALHANVYDYLASLDPTSGLRAASGSVVKGRKRDIEGMAKPDYGATQAMSRIRRRNKRMKTWNDLSG